jgi:Arc/MetJ-type ribon-helix-helix transcriptional regulator
MQKQDSRIAIRLPSNERNQVEQLIRQGKYRNISSVIREALKQFLEN